MSLPGPGEKFIAEIDRVSNAGNGIVEAGDSLIITGPAPEDSVGEKIEGIVEKTRGDIYFSLCLTEEFLTEEYLRWAKSKFLTDTQKATVTAQIDRISNSGNPIIADSELSEEILVYGDSQPKAGQVVTVRIRDSSHKHNGRFRGDLVRTVDKDKMREWKEKHRRKLDINRKKELDVDKNLIGAGEKASTDQGGSNQSSSNTSHLREQAKKAAVEEVSEETETTTQVKPQYSRSQEIKKYVQSRADGVCEGCGNRAPFTSKTGEPYLHVHHIFELGDGGSDTPDTVVALCPNCHYRVHHGEDGDDYNRRLLKKVQQLEDK